MEDTFNKSPVTPTHPLCLFEWNVNTKKFQTLTTSSINIPETREVLHTNKWLFKRLEPNQHSTKSKGLSISCNFPRHLKTNGWGWNVDFKSYRLQWEYYVVGKNRMQYQLRKDLTQIKSLKSERRSKTELKQKILPHLHVSECCRPLYYQKKM